MSDYSELKRLAEGCPFKTYEKFEYDAAGGKAYCIGHGVHDHLLTTFERSFQEFIAEASPASVLALIAENERLRLALKSAEDAMWKAESNMDNEAADIRDLLAAMDQGERSDG